jgi:hypothetical protein
MCRGHDGCAEQRKSIAQGISRYVVNKVVHHDQTVHERKQIRGNGIGIRVRRDVAVIAPPARPVRRCGPGFRGTARGQVCSASVWCQRIWTGYGKFGDPDHVPFSQFLSAPVPFRPIEHLIYNFPVLISSTLFRICVQFSD